MVPASQHQNEAVKTLIKLVKCVYKLFLRSVGDIKMSMFPQGVPLDSTLHVQNGDFQACGQIVSASIAQGGPAMKCLDESVYMLMVQDMSLLQYLRHLILTDT